MKGWTARELGRLLNIPVTTLTNWIGLGLVTPEHRRRGRGGHVIGLSGLMEFLAVIDLRKAGFSTQAIGKAVENIRRLSGQARPLAHLVIVVSGDDIAWMDQGELSDTSISTLQQPGQRLMLFPVGEEYSLLVSALTNDLTDKEAA